MNNLSKPSEREKLLQRKSEIEKELELLNKKLLYVDTMCVHEWTGVDYFPSEDIFIMSIRDIQSDYPKLPFSGWARKCKYCGRVQRTSHVTFIENPETGLGYTKPDWSKSFYE